MKSLENSELNQHLLAYIPAINSAYLDLLEKYPDTSVGVIGQEILDELPHLRKDIRALKPDDAAELINGIYANRAKVIGRGALFAILSSPGKVVMPDDEVTVHVLENYSIGSITDVEKYPIFLRWSRKNTKMNVDVQPDRVIRISGIDESILETISAELKKPTNWWRNVAGVIVLDNEIIASGHNTSLPTEFTQYIDGDPRANLNRGDGIEFTNDHHAEAEMISRAAREGLKLEGTELFISVFPCPKCAKDIANAGIDKVYYLGGYAMLDGQTILQSSGVEIIRVEGFEEEEIDRVVRKDYPEKN